MKKSTKWGLVGAVVIIVATVAVTPSIIRTVKARSDQPEQQRAQHTPMRNRTLNVDAEIVGESTMTDNTFTTGDILPAEEVDLSFETAGKVVAIYFTEGEYVRKGTLLAKINDAPLQAQLKKLQAQIPLAKDRVYRQQTLLEKDAVSQEAYEAVQTEYDKLMADIELVKANIAQTELRAPFDGVVGIRSLSEGAYASPSTKVVKLSQVSQLKIDFSVPESYASDIRRGTRIKFRMSDSDGIMREYSAAVYAVEGKIDAATRTLRVRALYANTRRDIIPGRFVSVEITRRQIDDAISVPSEAIIPEMGRNIVYLYRNGKASPQEIVTGIRTASRVQVIEGLQPGDTLLTTGIMQLRTGSNVIIDNINTATDR